jgi:hypothetical protein
VALIDTATGTAKQVRRQTLRRDYRMISHRVIAVEEMTQLDHCVNQQTPRQSDKARASMTANTARTAFNEAELTDLGSLSLSSDLTSGSGRPTSDHDGNEPDFESG